MELRQLEYFLVLCEELHFTRAAQRLYISQPTLSQQIKVLEQKFGLPLFDRIGKKILLTDAGQVLYTQCLQIFKQIENAKQQMQELHELQKGHLKIASLPGELTNLLSESALAYMEEYPGMQVSITSTDDVYTLLKENKVDYAFSYAQHALTMYDEQFVELPLYTEEFYYVTYPTDPLLRHQELTLNQLADVSFVLFPTIHVCRNILDKVLKKEELALKVQFETASTQAIFQFVQKKLGGTIVAKSLYESQESAELVGRPIHHSDLRRDTVLIVKKDKYWNAVAKSFMPMLIDYLTNNKLIVSAHTLRAFLSP
ncbi:LysR family transcriptional regulator [Lysinibacillus sp. KU-BSD001]|uniref:LysR family transcriptional regulator n=1 Tax=Lysinibacillus sp. KU-BSD001 TaxID=3141328 RepID=UPI0036E121C4